MQALCKSSFDNDGSTTLLSCAICGVWEKEGRHVCHMPISLRVNTSTATRQNVGQEHTVFSTSLLQNHISKSYQKNSRPILLRLLTTMATCQEKVFV